MYTLTVIAIIVIFSQAIIDIEKFQYHPSLLHRYHKQVRNVGTSVTRTVSLIRYGSDQPVDKGVRITKVALYM